MVFWATVWKREAVGSEQRHDFPSPWLIVSSDNLHSVMPIVIAVPLTSKLQKGDGAFRVHRIRIPLTQISKLQSQEKQLNDHDQLALTEQVRVLSHDRLKGQPVAMVKPQALYSVEAGLRHVLDMP
ncbi:MAG: type II toxin-antitoxin system PemK/MazF family toxin [Myxococcota bacterium]